MTQSVVGTFDHGIPYRLELPTEWNGVLVNDLDFVAFADKAAYQTLLSRGFACAGTGRSATRSTGYDPLVEQADLLAVIDLFCDRFEPPERLLQYGYSGGGLDAFSMAELHAERFDGVVATCSSIGAIPGLNAQLDAYFVLKTLLAPTVDLDFVRLPSDTAAATAAWAETVDRAHETAAGRARLALAMTVGQLPSWSDPERPPPDPSDAHAVEEAMHRTLLVMLGRRPGSLGFAARRMVEQSFGGNPNWNVGVDYFSLFNRSNVTQQVVVHRLYEEAGLKLESDLTRVEESPRISADPAAVVFGSVQGRLAGGTPRIPTFIMHTIGDASAAITPVESYVASARSHGVGDLVEMAFVERAGHGTFTVSEVVTAIETVLARIEQGEWTGSLTPDSLNSHAAALGVGESAFVPFELDTFNRPFYPDCPYPA